MAYLAMKYGSGTLPLCYPDEWITDVVRPNPVPGSGLSEEEVVRQALANPIGTPPLHQLVAPGQTVCVLIPDITRVWQKPRLYVPLVIEELRRGGVRDQDILILSATGSHRRQTPEEHKALVSEEIYHRIRVLDHDCRDTDALRYTGTTSRGTPVFLNRHALDCDHLVLTGGILYHFLAGFGGGKKYIFPGICGYQTIMHNHAMSFNEGMGSGRNHNTRNGNMNPSNPIHMDMLEGAWMAKPRFLLNVVMDSSGAIQNAVAGHLERAHETGVEMVRALDEVSIRQKAPLVIVSAGGFPKDINLYQTAKTLYNAMEAATPGGTLIVLSECREGLGSADMETILALPNQPEREQNLREDYSIGKGICYDICQCAETHRLILVSALAPALLQNIPVQVVPSLEEALAHARLLANTVDIPACLMPFGANTVPRLLPNNRSTSQQPGGDHVGTLGCNP